MGTREVVIIAGMHRIGNAYSVSYVVREQLKALKAARVPTRLITYPTFDESTLPLDGMPLLVDKHLDPADPSSLRRCLQRIAPHTVVFCHDLLFLTEHEPFARQLHLFIPPHAVSIYHIIHSGAQHPCHDGDATYRCSLPMGHKLIAMSSFEQLRLAHYYDCALDRIEVLPNHLSPLLSRTASRIAIQAELLSADYALLCPLSMPRWETKGVLHQLRLVQALGERASLLIADAHSWLPESQRGKQALRRVAEEYGVTRQVTFASDLNSAPQDMPNEVVRELFSVCNLFALTSQAEACPLVVLEAALAGCLLVVNRDLHGVQEMLAMEDMVWTSLDGDLRGLADHLAALLDNPMNNAKRRFLRERGTAAYALALLSLLD